MSSVPVVDGRFHVTLLVKHEYFNGQKLYLQVVLGTSTRLMCEEILAVPYALSVMPGAEIKNTVSEVTLNNFESVVGKTTAIGVDATASGGLINYGVRGSIDSTTGAGVYAYAEAATSRALFARNNQGGTAAYLYGNLTQNVEGYGVVKAGVLVFCGDPSGTERQFGPNTITNSGIGTGVCELDFGFDLSNRFWQVSTPNTTVPRFVSCLVKETDNNVLQCTRWTSTGSQINGEIMVLIY